MNRRVLFVVPSLRGGGAERVITHLMAHMDREGLDVALLALKLEGPNLKRLPPDLEIIDLNTPRLRNSLFKLVRAINAWKPDVVFSTLGHLNIALLALRPFLRSRPRLIVREANAPSLALAKGGKGRYLLFRSLYRWMYPRADRIVALSGGMARDMMGFAGIPLDKITIIHNPVSLAEIRSKAEEPVEHPWLQGRTKPVVLSIGRLALQKDYGTLLRAFARVRREVDARLVILGQGPEAERLQAIARELGIEAHVDFRGYVDNPYPYLRQADLFALTSRYEGMPNVLLEALALGVPIVATDAVGVADVLDGGKYGEIVPIGAVEAIAASMTARLRKPQARESAREALIGRAADFRVERIAEEYRRLLLSL